MIKHHYLLLANVFYIPLTKCVNHLLLATDCIQIFTDRIMIAGIVYSVGVLLKKSVDVCCPTKKIIRMILKTDQCKQCSFGTRNSKSFPH